MRSLCLKFIWLCAFSLCNVFAQTAATLTVQGDVAAPLTLKSEDLAQMHRETATIPEHEAGKATYEGVPLQEILKKAGVPMGKDLRGKTLSTYILAKAKDGYEVVFSLGELDSAMGNESILVADKREGATLAEKLGPLRLVVANDKVGARSVRMLETIEVVRLLK